MAESSLSVDSYEDPPTLSRGDVSKSEVDLLASLKANMIGQASISTEDNKHLKSRIRVLEEENDRRRKDVQFFQGKYMS